MSRFLAPIHFRVYDKIQKLEDMVEEILNLAKDKSWSSNINVEVDKNAGSVERSPLEDVINTDNIHGWLQNQIIIVEKRLAFVVSHLLLEDKTREEVILSTVMSIAEKSAPTNLESAKEAFELIEQVSLDGMPCDRANEIIESDDNRVIWHRLVDVHKDFWNYGIPVEIFYNIREAWIKGILKNTQLNFIKQNEETFLLERSK